jgi:hypothetical protein
MTNDTLLKSTHKGKSHVERSVVTEISQTFAPSILMVAQKVENCLREQICTIVELVAASFFRTAILTLKRKIH